MHFEIVRLIGRGAFGEVHLVRSCSSATTSSEQKSAEKPSASSPSNQHGGPGGTLLQTGGSSASNAEPSKCREYALKSLFCHCPEDDHSVVGEVDLLKRVICGHRNLVKLVGNPQYDAMAQKVHFLLEYMPGGDLQKHIEAQKEKGDPFSLSKQLKLYRELSSALGFLHSQKVLHRDVKAANVLLAVSMAGDNEDELPSPDNSSIPWFKLADFGIAKHLDHTQNATSVVGTPFYLSPEICQGEPYGEASDVWAFGILMYEFIKLQRAFQASNPLALVNAICRSTYQPLPDDCPIKEQIHGFLIKDPVQRKTLELDGKPYCPDSDPGKIKGELFVDFFDTWQLGATTESKESTVVSSLDEEKEESMWRSKTPAQALKDAVEAAVWDPFEVRALLSEAKKHPDTSKQVIDSAETLLEKLKEEALSQCDNFSKNSSPSLYPHPRDLGDRAALPPPEHQFLQCPSTPNLALQCAVEIASTLGEHLPEAEDRLAEEANVRRMVSVKVLWDDEVRMLTIPRRLTWSSLLLEIGRRFKAQIFALSYWDDNNRNHGMSDTRAAIMGVDKSEGDHGRRQNGKNILEKAEDWYELQRSQSFLRKIEVHVERACRQSPHPLFFDNNNNIKIAGRPSADSSEESSASNLSSKENNANNIQDLLTIDGVAVTPFQRRVAKKNKRSSSTESDGGGGGNHGNKPSSTTKPADLGAFVLTGTQMAPSTRA